MGAYVTLHLFLKPQEELVDRNDHRDAEVTPEQLHRLADGLSAHLHQQAKILGKLQDDGWKAELSLYSIDCHHPDVRKEPIARKRLEKLGIDLDKCCVSVSEDDEFEVDDDDADEAAEAEAPDQQAESESGEVE